MPDDNSEPKIDAHMHVWNRVHGQIAGRHPVEPISGGRIRIGDNEVLGMPAYMLDCKALAEYFVAEMDAAGVAAGVVVQEYLDGEQNDYLLEVAKRYLGRFFVHGLPNWLDPDLAVKDVESLLGRGFRGIKLPAMHLNNTITLDDPRLMRAYRAIDDADAVLAIDLSEGTAQVPAFRHVLETFPMMKVAIGHFGMPTRGGWPGQLDLCRYDNVHIEMGGLVWLYRASGIGFSDALGAIHEAIDRVGVHKLMWGSDWPRTMVDFTYEQTFAFIRDDPGLSEIDKGLIFGGNAQRLYELQLPARRGQAGPLPKITEG